MPPPADKTATAFSESHKHAASKGQKEEEGGPWLNLWVGNLSPYTVDEDLRAVFTKHGAMDSVTSYDPRTYAFVYFRTIRDAKAARDALQGTKIRGKPIKIEFARPAKPGKTLWVGGISQSVTKEKLEDEFMKFGKIEEYKFLRHRGSAFIGFQDIEDAVAAQKSMNWKQLHGAEMRVDFQRLPPPRRPFGGRRDGQTSNVLWVGYPSELQIDGELLHNSMILFGEIERIKSFPSRHYCFVEFRSVDEAHRAKEGLQGCLLGDSRIQILFHNNEPGRENPPISGQEDFFNEPSIGLMELFGAARSMGPNHFPGRLNLNGMWQADVLRRPFTQGFDPNHRGSEFHDISGGMHGFPDGITKNQMAANGKRLSPTAPGMISFGPRIHPPFRPSQWGWDEYDMREPKRSRLDGPFPFDDDRFQGGIVNSDDMLDFPGLPHLDRILPSHRHQTQGPGPSRASPGIDYFWRGIIAKGGTPVCYARCLHIGNGIGSAFPDVVNCSARTGLDLLTSHYAEAIGFDMVYFLPDSEEDFASYTEFLQFLGQRDRAGVAKFDDGTTMFLVPPSDFLTKVLEFSGPERLYGVVLKMPQQTTAVGKQQAIVPLPDPINHQPGHVLQKIYDFVAENEDQSLKFRHGSSFHERSIPNAGVGGPSFVHSEETHATPSMAQNHLKSHESTSQAKVSLTPELIAPLASIIPTSSHPSATLSDQIPSSSYGIPASFSGTQINDNSMLVQQCGQEAGTTFSGTSVVQMYNPMQNLPLPRHQYSNQVPLVPQFPTYTNIPNGLNNSFQPAMDGMLMQGASLNMQQVPGNMETVGNTLPYEISQFQASHSNQTANIPSIYNLPDHQQSAPASTASGHSGSLLQIPVDTCLISDRLNVDLPSQVQPLKVAISTSDQGASEGNADKEQRYQSTLQFAATLLLRIQQQQQAKAQAAQGSENQL